MNPIRKIIQKTGFDFHKHRPVPNKLSFLRLLNLQTVLDIGANTGQFAQHIRRELPRAHIFAFEPLKQCFEALEYQFRDDRLFNVYNVALGDKHGEVNMHKSQYSPSSSLLPMSETHKKLFPHTKDHTNEGITVKKLDDAVRDIHLVPEILIKVDVQGFEEKVLIGGKETFKKARAVIMEVSFMELYEGQPSFDTLYQHLKELGLSYHGSLEQKVDKNTGEIISEDSLFIR